MYHSDTNRDLHTSKSSRISRAVTESREPDGGRFPYSYSDTASRWSFADCTACISVCMITNGEVEKNRGLCQNAPLARMRRWRKNLKCSCTACTLRFQNFPPPCLQTKSIILTQPLDSGTAPQRGGNPLSIILTQPLDSVTAPQWSYT